MPTENKAVPFERQERYIVLKLSRLPKDETEYLRDCQAKAMVECVVVERDWPEYHLVWTMIEHRMAGKPVPDFNLWRRADELQQRLTAADERAHKWKELLRSLDEAWNSHDGRDLFGRLMRQVEAELKPSDELAKQHAAIDFFDAALKPVEANYDSCELCKGWGFSSNSDGVDEGCGACNGTGKEPEEGGSTE